MALVAFTLSVGLVMVAAWQGRGDFEFFLRDKLGIKRISLVYLPAWALAVAMFFWFFRHGLERWELLCLLVEVTGVTFLAREVNKAQRFEYLKNRLERFADLKEITDPEEYYLRYWEIEGKPEAEVKKNLDIEIVYQSLQAKVAKLRTGAASTFERMRGETADLLSRNRKKLLFLGLALVALALWGHGVLALTKPEKPLSAGDPAFMDAMTQVQSSLAGLGQRIADLEGQVAAQRKEIEAIKQENKRWHVVRPRSKQCYCPQASAQPLQRQHSPSF